MTQKIKKTGLQTRRESNSCDEREVMCVSEHEPWWNAERGMVDPPCLSSYRSRCTLHELLQAKRFSCRGWNVYIRVGLENFDSTKFLCSFELKFSFANQLQTLQTAERNMGQFMATLNQESEPICTFRWDTVTKQHKKTWNLQKREMLHLCYFIVWLELLICSQFACTFIELNPSSARTFWTQPLLVLGLHSREQKASSEQYVYFT